LVGQAGHRNAITPGLLGCDQHITRLLGLAVYPITPSKLIYGEIFRQNVWIDFILLVSLFEPLNSEQ
jgi:hypothetical protein